MNLRRVPARSAGQLRCHIEWAVSTCIKDKLDVEGTAREIDASAMQPEEYAELEGAAYKEPGLRTVVRQRRAPCPLYCYREPLDCR